MGLYALLESTQRDVTSALDTAIERVLARPELMRQAEELGATHDQIVAELGKVRGDMLAGVASQVNQLERVRRAQNRLQAVGRRAAQRDRKTSEPAESRRTEKPPQALKKIAQRIPERQPAPRVEGGQLWQTLDQLVQITKPALERSLEDQVVAPQVRRLLNRLRQEQRGQEALFATDLGDVDIRGLRAQVDEDLFVRTRSLEELGRLLTHLPRGSVGIAGSRGVGKSTALEHVERVIPRDGESGRPPFRVNVSAPTEYVPQEFLMHLLGEIATKWLRERVPAAGIDREDSIRARAVALTVTAVLPLLLLVVGGWSLGSYVATTGLSTPAASMPLVVAFASVLAAGFLGRQAGLRLHRPWSLLVRTEGIRLTAPDEFRDLAPTTYTARVIMLTGTAMAVLASAVIWADSYPLAGSLSASELAAVLLVVVATAALVGSFATLDFHLQRSTSPVGTMSGVVVGVTALAVGMQGLGPLLLPDFTLAVRVVVGAALTAAAVCCATLRLGIRGDPKAEPEQHTAVDLAREDLRRLRFQRSSAVGTTTALKLGASSYLPFEASRGVSRSVTDVEATLTVPETVKLIRELLLAIHHDLREEAGPDETVRIVVAIDEMDKLEASDRARDFLNEIKGVFGIEGVVFLVSVSEDAMASFERRGLAFRDAFDSAFDEVVHLPQLSFRETRDILRAKVIPEMPLPFVALAHCLAGGLARDVLRTVHHIAECEPPRSIQAVTSAAIHREIRGKWKGAVSALRPLPLEPHVTDLILVMYRIDRCKGDQQVDDRCVTREDAFEEIDRLRLRGIKDADLPDLRTLLRLAGEYVGFCYFCRTLDDFFGTPDEGLLVGRLRRAMDDDLSERHTLDYLARARYHLAVKPRLGWEAISFFRERHGLGPALRYPPVLLGEVAGSTTPRTSASRAHVGAGPRVSMQRMP